MPGCYSYQNHRVHLRRKPAGMNNRARTILALTPPSCISLPRFSNFLVMRIVQQSYATTNPHTKSASLPATLQRITAHSSSRVCHQDPLRQGAEAVSALHRPPAQAAKVRSPSERRRSGSESTTTQPLLCYSRGLPTATLSSLPKRTHTHTKCPRQ